MNRFLALGTIAACSVSALAFATDCWDPTTVADKKICASRDYAAADKELNAAWPVALAYMKFVDSDNADRHSPLPASLTPAATLLTTAQRAWISHRDLDCEASTIARNAGSLSEVVKNECLTDKTRARTFELLDIHAQADPYELPEEVQSYFEEIKLTLPGCKNLGSNDDSKDCIFGALKVADRKLNEIYSSYKNDIAHHPAAVKSLVSSQLAWITIRDKDCQAIHREEYGVTSYTGVVALCHFRKTIERKDQLFTRFSDM